MKSLRKYLLGLGVLLVLLGLLIWFLPARWAMPWIEPHLHGLQLQQVHGTLWRGRSDQVLSRAGQPLGRATWQLSRRSLLGEAELQLNFAGASLSFDGFAKRLEGQKIELKNVNAHADVGLFALPSDPSFGKPRGTLTMNVDHAVLQGGWPMEMALTAQWKGAAVGVLDGDLVLGTLALQASASNGIVQAQMHDVGNGPLAANGQVQLSPFGWRLDVKLSSRQTDPRLDRWLAQFAPPAADGSVHIKQTGGLAGALPPADAIQDATQP